MSLGDPHPQCLAMLCIYQLYLSVMLSRNSCLFKAYPNQDRGRVVNQLDAPFYSVHQMSLDFLPIGIYFVMDSTPVLKHFKA